VYFPLHNFYLVYDLKNSKLLRVTESRVVDVLIDNFKGQFDIGRTLKLSKDNCVLFVSIEDKRVRWYYDISSLNFSQYREIEQSLGTKICDFAVLKNNFFFTLSLDGFLTLYNNTGKLIETYKI